MSFVSDLVVFMAETDIINLFFPWLLLLAFTFGVLRKYEFFEDEAVAGAVSLSTSFLAIAGIYFFMPEGIFANFGAIIALAAFASLGFMIVMAVAGIDLNNQDNLKLPMGAGLIILIIGIIAVGINNVPSINLQGINAFQDIVMPIILLLFILGIVAVTAGGD
jgi:hypothetical protein